MPTAASSQVLSTTPLQIFNATNDLEATVSGVAGFMVRNLDPTNSVEVNVNGLHKSGEYVRIVAGSNEYFRCNNAGIRAVTAKAVAGTPAITYGVVARIDN